MSNHVIQNFEAPLFARVAIMGHQQHECALVTAAKIAGVELLAVTPSYSGENANNRRGMKRQKNGLLTRPKNWRPTNRKSEKKRKRIRELL